VEIKSKNFRIAVKSEEKIKLTGQSDTSCCFHKNTFFLIAKFHEMLFIQEQHVSSRRNKIMFYPAFKV